MAASFHERFGAKLPRRLGHAVGELQVVNKREPRICGPNECSNTQVASSAVSATPSSSTRPIRSPSPSNAMPKCARGRDTAAHKSSNSPVREQSGVQPLNSASGVSRIVENTQRGKTACR